MKRTFKRTGAILLALVLCLSLLPLTAAAADVTYIDDYAFALDADGNYLIQSVDDWNGLAAAVADGYDCDGLSFLMTADIGTADNPVTRPLGQQVGSNKSTDRRRFAGTFDGGGHTLTVCLNSADQWFSFNKGYVSPFAYVRDTAIRNLHVAGSVTTTAQWASGLVGSTGNNTSDGACTIENCHVSVEIHANYQSHGTTYANHGGFIGIAEGPATITGSWFDGQVLGADYAYSGGFIGMNKARGTTINNCLFNPSKIEAVLIEGACEFVHDIGGGHTLNGAYYVSHFGEDPQGTRVHTTYAQGDHYTTVTFGGTDFYVITEEAAWEDIGRQLSDLDGADTVTLTQDIEAGSTDTALVVPAGRTVTLDLAGHTIDRDLLDLIDTGNAPENGYVIKVEADASLTITDSVGGGVITGGYNNGYGGGIYNAGSLKISDVTIRDNAVKGSGGGVYVAPSSSFTMDSGAVVSHNTSTTSHGGGVYVAQSAMFIMDSGAAVSHNTSKSSGGGIYSSGGIVMLFSCTISENQAVGGLNGAGVFLDNVLDDGNTLSSTLLLGEGCVITDNEGTKNDTNYGVGVYAAPGTVINLQGGKITITDNMSMKGGRPTSEQNVYLDKDVDHSANIQVTDELDAETLIGVSMPTPGVFAYDLAGRGMVTNFKSDNADYLVGMDESGLALLGSPATVSFAAGDGTGEMDNVSVAAGSVYTLPECTFTPPMHMTFDKWQIPGSSFAAGDTVTISENTTVTATYTPLTEPVFKSKSLLLTGQIGVNFFMDLSCLSDDEKAASYMTFTVGNSTEEQSADYNASFKDETTGEYYGFTCFVTSIEMADDINAVFHYGDNETLTLTYSVDKYLSYFDDHQSDYNEKTLRLIESIADYGHFVQPFLAANNDWRVGEDHKEMSRHYTDSYDLGAVKTSVAGYTFEKLIDGTAITAASYRLYLDSETTLDVYLTVPEGTELTASATFNGTTYNAEQQSDGRYRIRIPGIAAHQLGDTITITGNAGGEFTVRVSALSYARSVLNNDSFDEYAKNAMAALYYYYDAVMQYRAN